MLPWTTHTLASNNQLQPQLSVDLGLQLKFLKQKYETLKVRKCLVLELMDKSHVVCCCALFALCSKKWHLCNCWVSHHPLQGCDVFYVDERATDGCCTALCGLAS